MDAFFHVASTATGAGAVLQMSKISESFNRVFLMKFENGSEAIARFPTQLAGPPQYAVASEVATMEFLRRRVGIPVPRVLAWNSKASEHEVGSEFILMEKAPGKSLYDTTKDRPLEPREKQLLAIELKDIEKRLLDIQFSGYGAIYFAHDISEKQRLPIALATEANKPHSTDTEFCLGPMARRDFYQAERISMDIDRGPCRQFKLVA